ncbi:hypothetical protein, partial [Staphylococcus pseudintermedius]|uniref:hypothetical protein n=1 Tax=Staphylococcus pseudintermedius TaxID=283734 RepID=UPI0010227C5C
MDIVDRFGDEAVAVMVEHTVGSKMRTVLDRLLGGGYNACLREQFVAAAAAAVEFVVEAAYMQN